MEVAAGYAEHVDVQVGRIVDELEALGYADNTLIFYIWGDNGSSGEGQNGTISELLAQNGIPTTYRMHIGALEEIGGLEALGSPKTDNQYHAGWAWAGSSPYKGMKLLASHLGGTRNPMIVRWPKGIEPDPTPRSQFHHCNDLVPTIYDVVGITPPRVVNGVPQDPIDGISFAYTLRRRRCPRAAPHPVLRDHGQSRHLPRRVDGVGDRSATTVGAGPAAGDPGVDARRGHLGALPPGGGLDAGP